MPEGQIVISGFNPLSLWGAKRRLGAAISRGNDAFPWNSRFIGLPRLKDWLALLGFEINEGRFGCYAPPFVQTRWIDRFEFMEKAGDRWWRIAGATYIVRAIKRNHGIRLVTPHWREARVNRRPLVQVARRDNVIHVRPIQRR